MDQKQSGNFGFEGLLNGKPATVIRGEIAQAGQTPYLLLALKGGWLIDLNPIHLDASRRNLILVDPENRRFSSTIKGAVTVHGDQVQLRLPLTLLIGQDEEVVTVSGTLVWPATQVSTPAPVNGEFSLRWRDQVYGPEAARLVPFNDGWRLTSIVRMGNGHTGAITLQMPALNDPVDGTLTFVETQMRPDPENPGEEEVATDAIGHHSLYVRAIEEGEQLLVRFEARGDSGRGPFIPLVGQFIAKRR